MAEATHCKRITTTTTHKEDITLLLHAAYTIYRDREEEVS